MKLNCSQSELNSALQLVSRAVSNRPTHPVLANVLLAADDDREGDAIAYHCGKIMNVDFGEKNRIIFHEISIKAIHESIQKLSKKINSLEKKKDKDMSWRKFYNQKLIVLLLHLPLKNIHKDHILDYHHMPIQ